MTDSTKVVNLQQLKDHIDGVGSLDNHKANVINLDPSLTILGEEVGNVQLAIEKLNSVAFPFIPEASENVKGILKLSGDLRGNSIDLPDSASQEETVIPRVRGLQGYPIANLRPSDGDVLTWDDAEGWWQPKPALGGGSFNYATPYNYGIVRLSDGFYPGDIGGTAGNLQIRGLQSYPLSLGGDNPVYPDQYLKWDGDNWTNSYLPLANFEQYGIVRLGGDIGGTAGNLQIIGIQGTPLDVTCAENGSAIIYDEAQGMWTCGLPNIGFSLTEDVAPGSVGGVKVVGLDNRPITHQSTLNNGDVLTYSGGSWSASALPDASASSKGVVKLINDLGGTSENPLVTGFYGQSLDQDSMISPSNKQMIQYVSYEGPGNGRWEAVSLNSVISFSGDLTGDPTIQRCIGWSGKELDSSFQEPTEGDIPVYNGAKWVLSNSGSTQFGNPEARTFYSEGVRNTYTRYQLTAVSRGSSNGLLLNYSVPDNTSIVMQGKIIARLVDDTFVPESEAPAIYLPNPESGDGESNLNQNLKFDLEDLQANTYYYDLNAGLESTTGSGSSSIAPLRYVDSGDAFQDIMLVAKYPYVSVDIEPPSISYTVPRNVVINTGYLSGTIIHWTLFLEIYENGV